MNRYFIPFIFVSLSAFLAACGGAEPAANNANANSNAAKSAAVNANADSNSPVAVTTPTPAATTNDAPTVGPVFKAYCAAVEKKDEAAIRRIYSADSIRRIEEEMNADGIDSLMEYFSNDMATTALCEVRNETITGSEAVAEVKTKSMPNGAKVLFVKEGNDWKLTNRVPGFEKK